ncbi:MAG: hypothetical protein NXI31_06295 [bacterium]|nr:hypothetical protein [bacterium]
MGDLKVLVDSILGDLIAARAEADALAADYAKTYREDPTLRAMSVPALNITNVSVELRIAFDDGSIEAAPPVSEPQARAAQQGARSLRTFLMGSTAFRTAAGSNQQRRVLATLAEESSKTALTTNANRPASVRLEEANRAVFGALERNNVQLSPTLRSKVTERLTAANSGVSAAARPQARTPSLIVGKSALETLTPEKISTVKFDVDLSESRWVEVEDDDGETEFRLTEG